MDSRTRHSVMLSLALAACPGLRADPGAPLPAGPLHPRSLSFPALTFEPARPLRKVTRQGITLLLVESRELPLVQLGGTFGAGDSLDPPAKLGLAALTARAARAGGAGRYAPAELDAALENVAASFELSAGRESTSFSGRALSRDLDLLLEVLRAVLVEPRFDPQRLEIERAKALEAIRRENDEPGPIARRELYKVIYGLESVWGRSPRPGNVKAITRDDVVAFHRSHYHPKDLVIGLAGDFDAAALADRIETLFDGWKPGTRAAKPAPTKAAASPGVWLVEKDLAQTTIRMGHLGLPRLHPDYHACLVMNRILGMGTFTSRMGIEIRSNRGLAYSVGSGLFEGGGPGPFIAVAQTKAASTLEVSELMRDIIAGMGKGDITDKELDEAKQTLLNQWIFEFESGAQLVSTRVEHEFHGYPADYLEEYPRKIAEVRVEDVVRCARKHLRPADLTVLVVGDPAKIGPGLERLGSVTRVALPKDE